MNLLDEIRSAVKGRTVLVTGHSGFKGGWLSIWLHSLGAKVVGISLPPDQGPDNLFKRASVADFCVNHWVDVRDAGAVQSVFDSQQPELVFHLAAQPLVRRGYHDPLLTFSTNIVGTANVLEAARLTCSVRAFVCVTTDKVYDNKEWCWPYREGDTLGGIDPYSASKAAAELVARSYMTALKRPPAPLRVATARGGNVVGGGDWSEDRIVPDIIRSIRDERELVLRNPMATRPWQHVLELCLGYLALAARLCDGRKARKMDGDFFVGAYNFGPEPSNEMPVRDLVALTLETWKRPNHPIQVMASHCMRRPICVWILQRQSRT